jgi:hypothetical protein
MDWRRVAAGAAGALALLAASCGGDEAPAARDPGSPAPAPEVDRPGTDAPATTARDPKAVAQRRAELRRRLLLRRRRAREAVAAQGRLKPGRRSELPPEWERGRARARARARKSRPAPPAWKDSGARDGPVQPAWR